MMNEHTGNVSGSNAQGEANQPQSAPASGTLSVKTKTEHPNCTGGKNDTHEKQKASRPQRIEAVCAVALVVITAFYTHYASQQACAAITAANAAKSAADTAASQLELAQRPWLSIVDARVLSDLTFGQNGGQVTFGFTIKNSGNSPAVDVWVGPELYLPDDTGSWETELRRTCTDPQEAKPSQPENGAVIFPNISTPFKIGTSMSNKDMDKGRLARSDLVAVVPMVCITYRSTFNRRIYHTGITYFPWTIRYNGGTVPVKHLPLVSGMGVPGEIAN
jgi:hypothetical protein